MVHAALLLLMLEAANADLFSTINLKRSTQNLQLSQAAGRLAHLNNFITIDDERIKNHLDRVVRGSVEETLNALLDAEADQPHCVSQCRAPLSPI
jgi:hypothetical protein